MNLKKICSIALAATLMVGCSQTTTSSEVTKDRSGNEITIPEKVETIVSLSPSTTQVLIDMGLEDQIVAVDTNSKDFYGSDLNKKVKTVDMMNPDVEVIVDLDPDLVFTSGLSSLDGEDTFKAVRDADIAVADIPSSTSIQAIEEDLEFIGDCVHEEKKADALIDEMETKIDEVKEISKDIEDQKSVLFMMSIPSSEAPAIYTVGNETFIDEMITIVGAKNVTGDQTSWISITEEDAVNYNPDVILTNVNYVENPVADILAIGSWSNVQAVQSKSVYQIDANASSQPNHHIVDALIEMAQDIYPEEYKSLK